MAEPLSITASIIAIIQLTQEVIKFCSAVHEADRHITRLRNELSSTNAILSQLLTLAIDAQKQPILTRNEVQAVSEPIETGSKNPSTRLNLVSQTLSMIIAKGGPLDQYTECVLVLKKKLAPVTGIEKAKAAIKWPLKEEINTLVSGIERFKTLFMLTQQQDHVALSHAIEENVQHVHKGLESVDAGLKSLCVQQEDQNARTLRAEEQATISWLSHLDFWAVQNDMYRLFESGTCQWFMDEFETWLQSTSRFLWCPGTPGSGKTIITSFTVSSLCKRYRYDSSVGTACVYCNYKERAAHTVESLLGSLCAQLARQQVVFSSDLHDLFSIRSAAGERPTQEVLQGLLHVQCQAFSHVYLCVDALDECTDDDSTRSKFKEAIQNLPNIVRVMITCRPHILIGDSGNENAVIEIRARDEDVRKYIEERRSYFPICVRRKESLMQDAIDVIVSSTGGMFLLAKLNLESLKDKLTIAKFKKALGLLPKGGGSNAIDTAYEEALNRVNSGLEGQRDLARRVLTLVTYAYRPLSVLEIREALSVERDAKRFDDEAMPEVEDLTDHCAGLVIIDEERHVVRLVHYTLQEYFARYRDEKLPGGHRSFAQICMTYLGFEDWRETHCTPDWVDHSELYLDEEDQTEEEIEGEGETETNIDEPGNNQEDNENDNDQGLDKNNHVIGKKMEDSPDVDSCGLMFEKFSQMRSMESNNDDCASWPTQDVYYIRPSSISDFSDLGSMLESHPFITYAMSHWTTHVKADSQEYHLDSIRVLLQKIARSKFSPLSIQFAPTFDYASPDVNVGRSSIGLNVLSDLSAYCIKEPLSSIALAQLGDFSDVVERFWYATKAFQALSY